MGKNIHLLHHRQIVANNRGFSLPEILVVVALAGIVILGNSTYLYNFMKDLDRIEKQSMEESELAILSRSAVNVVKRSSLSFNKIQLADDSNKNFFDYYPDLSLNAFATGSESRTYTINAADTSKFIYFIASEESDFDSIVYDPVHAYTLTDAATLLADGTISYRGINTVPDLQGEDGSAASQKLMTAVFKTRWADGKVFVITCPTYLRPLNASNTVDLSSVPRTASFVGKVLADNLVPVPVSESVVSMGNTHPVTGVAYVGLDDYFRKLPTVGGAAPFVKVEPAQLVRFKMVANSAYPSGYADLKMDTWANGSYGSTQMVADRIKTVRFTRKSVTLPLIGMEIEK